MGVSLAAPTEAVAPAPLEALRHAADLLLQVTPLLDRRREGIQLLSRVEPN